LTVTLWQYAEPTPGALTPAETAAAIKVVHEALADSMQHCLASRWSWMTPGGFCSRSLAPLGPLDRRFLSPVVSEVEALTTLK
jgi:hypothetical protein